MAGFWRAERGSAQGFKPFPTASRFLRVRFEPKIFWREIFLEGRSFVFAISSSVKASFIHPRVGSIHADGLRKRRCICSSTDFLSDIKERRCKVPRFLDNQFLLTCIVSDFVLAHKFSRRHSERGMNTQIIVIIYRPVNSRC